MADLFTLPELAAALQVDSVDPVQGDLVRRRVTARIESVIGVVPSPIPATVWEVALSAAARAYSNPAGLRSETIGSYSYTRDRGASGGVYLTGDEIRALRRVVGLSPSVPLTGYGLNDALLGRL